MTQPPVSTEMVESVGIIRFNRPDVLNALNPATVTALVQAVLSLISEQGARCIVLTGAGRAFSSGADLSGGDDGNAATANRAEAVLQKFYHPMLRTLRDCPVPLVTAVNGPAVGAGMSIALMGDIITASQDAYFLQAFARIGLVPDSGSSWLLPRLVGAARARELSLLAEKLPAEKALNWGLVNRVYPADTLMAETLKIAKSLADGPVNGLSRIRKLYWESDRNSFEDQLNLEDELQLAASLGPEFAEGVAAFTEKRAPDFRKVSAGRA
ncbi:enoyl-CoA hydratase-related protein [Seohaeicola nanhaiensis]|uniref:Enoyl-CoA hydratase-related protein n=1 Tax=Seohaeicola nanhaiensis TaxID=1387282 RepID=A0ABV9KL35_9RHOB